MSTKNFSKTLKKDSFFLFSTKKMGDKYYKFGTKINENTYESKSIIRYFYDSETLTNVLSKNFEILELEADKHKNLDQTISVWWKILVKNKE